MPAISRLIAVAPPGDVLESLRFAFERDGAKLAIYDGADGPDEIAEMLAERDGDETVRGHDVIIASSGSTAEATTLLGKLRAVIKKSPVRMPIVYLGNELSVDEGIAAGANAVLSQPLFVRDVVVATGLVARRRRADLARGDLKDFDGLFYIFRALTQFERSAVLTVVRGLRRGEVRFFKGQATSAQIGPLHGLSALHHLMLWKVGTFELRFESVVQRQQIPLPTDELWTDVRRFLAEVHETARSLSFSGSYETVEKRVAEVAIPNEIRQVLELMDGSRTLPDIVEDSPFRMFETLRIATRLLELKLIRHVSDISSNFGFKMRRQVEEMVLSPQSPVPVAVTGEETGRTVKLNRNHVPEEVVPDGAPQSGRELDWSDVMPATPGTDDKVAQVVPAAVAAGEITVAGEESDRSRADTSTPARSSGAEPSAESGSDAKPQPEKLETFTSAEERDRLFALGESPAGERTSHDNRRPEADPEPQTATTQETGARESQKPVEESSDMAANAPGETGGSDHFSDDEEAFFQAGRDIENSEPPPVENFDDLDEGYQPVSFWQRLFGRRPRPRGGRATTTERKSTSSGQRASSRDQQRPGSSKSTQRKAEGARSEKGPAQSGKQSEKQTRKTAEAQSENRSEKRDSAQKAASKAEKKATSEPAGTAVKTGSSASSAKSASEQTPGADGSGRADPKPGQKPKTDQPATGADGTARMGKRRPTTKSDGNKRKKRKKKRKKKN